MYNFRILTKDRRIKYAGTDTESWMTLETAKKLVNYKEGEGIFEFNNKGEILWEVL